MLIKRFVIFCLGVFLLALGVVLNTQLRLGVPPVGILPFVLSQLSSMTLGQMTIAFYLILVLAQFLLVKQMRVKILLQIPFSLLFGLLVDGVNHLLTLGELPFIMAVSLLLVAILLVAFGVYLMISTNVVLNPADGFVQTIVEVKQSDFGKVKRAVDAGLVILSVIVSWVFSGQLLGFGIGTILSALVIGYIISRYKKWFDSRLYGWIER